MRSEQGAPDAQDRDREGEEKKYYLMENNNSVSRSIPASCLPSLA